MAAAADRTSTAASGGGGDLRDARRQEDGARGESCTEEARVA